MKKCLFIVPWFGELPNYFDIWLKSVGYNSEFEFLIITDFKSDKKLPDNVRIENTTFKNIKNRIQNMYGKSAKCDKPYRLCDYRPMYGEIFKDEIAGYDFWGYCDVDLVFGKLSDFITEDMLEKYDAVFNAGHLTLIRNIASCNNLYKKRGSVFDYKTVIKHNAVFAFDEFTGIQRIAKANGINAKYGIPFVDVNVRYNQITSVRDKNNPEIQAYYWEKGELYRVVDKNGLKYQKLAYIHMQKRIIERIERVSDSFWVAPHGYCKKSSYGKPQLSELKRINPFEGNQIRKKMQREYWIKKMFQFMSRNPYQVFVRLKQQIYGINKFDALCENDNWKSY